MESTQWSGPPVAELILKLNTCAGRMIGVWKRLQPLMILVCQLEQFLKYKNTCLFQIMKDINSSL